MTQRGHRILQTTSFVRQRLTRPDWAFTRVTQVHVGKVRFRRLERVDDVRATQDFGAPIEVAFLFG